MKIISISYLVFLFSIGCAIKPYQGKVFSEAVIEIPNNGTKPDTFTSAQFFSYKDVLVQIVYVLKGKTEITKQGVSNTQQELPQKFLLVDPFNNSIYEFDLKGNYLTTDTSLAIKRLFTWQNELEKKEDKIIPVFQSIKQVADLKDSILSGATYKLSAPVNVYDTVGGNSQIQCFFTEDKNLKTRFNILGHYPNKFSNYCLTGIYLVPEKIPSKLMTLIYDIKPLSVEEENSCIKMYMQLKNLRKAK